MGESLNFLELEHNGEIIRLWAENRGSSIWIHFNGRIFVYEESKKIRVKSVSIGSGIITAPMPGKIIKIYVETGEMVQVGQVIVVIEAMKMEYALRADISGKVERFSCAEGDQVTLGQELALIKEQK